MGYGLLFDPLLDYHLQTISSTSDSKFTELALPTLANLSSNARSPSPAQPRRTTKPATYLAYPFPDDTPLRSPGQSLLAGLRIPPHILREKDPISADAIKALGDITVRIRNTVTSVLRVGEGLRRRYSCLAINLIVDSNFSIKNSPHNYQNHHQPAEQSNSLKRILPPESND